MDDNRAAHIKATAAEHAWTHGGRDLTRFIFELLDERTKLCEAMREIQGVVQSGDNWISASRIPQIVSNALKEVDSGRSD